MQFKFHTGVAPTSQKFSTWRLNNHLPKLSSWRNNLETYSKPWNHDCGTVWSWAKLCPEVQLFWKLKGNWCLKWPFLFESRSQLNKGNARFMQSSVNGYVQNADSWNSLVSVSSWDLQQTLSKGNWKCWLLDQLRNAAFL